MSQQISHLRTGILVLSDKGFRGEREDTSGPAMNILLKVMTIVSLVFASAFV